MYTFNPTHTPARSLFHTGNIAATRPSMGAWISYGLGQREQESAGLRGAEPRPSSGGGLCARRLPARPNIRARSFDDSVTEPDKMIRYLQNKELDKDAQRQQLDLIQAMNREHEQSFGQDEYLEGRIQSMETAYSMQFEATDVFDIRKEPESVRERIRRHAIRPRLPAGAAPGGARRAHGARLLRSRASRGTTTRTSTRT